ncbi:allatostatin-A receptor-like [Mytilus galloprovincialis]|uniref:allatostatin-A receptor-like n=1 Tax=Mytilus galloprovincialis TaxID=29158 RepID=UPI003F7B74F1
MAQFDLSIRTFSELKDDNLDVKQNTTGIFIVNLAVVDFLYIMVYVPFIVTIYFKGSRVFGDILCKLSNYLLYVSATISVYTLVLVSVDRYLAIVHPITSKKFRTRRNVNLVVLITWLVVSAYANSCINPILYTFLSTKYRQSLRKLICCTRQRPNN